MLKSSAVAAAAAVVLLKVLGCRLTYFWGQAETSAEAWFNIALRPWKPEGSVGRTAQDGHLDSHTAPELWWAMSNSRHGPSPVVFEESAILPAKGRNQKWKCWLWGVQETRCHEIYTPQDTEKLPRSNHDDLLDRRFASARSDRASL